MPTELMRRFGHWLGTWRGPCDFADGRTGLIRFELTSIFFGEAIQLDVSSFDETGEIITRGWGFLSLDRKGRVVDNCYGNRFGFAVLTETPDDEEVLSLSGPLPGNLTMDLTMNVVDDYYSLSVRIHEGYQPTGDQPRTFTRMQRIGLRPRPQAQPETEA